VRILFEHQFNIIPKVGAQGLPAEAYPWTAAALSSIPSSSIGFTVSKPVNYWTPAVIDDEHP
jgi:hypothetical protein